ncbi:hypothetical protein LX87_00719 [Larkinella arboricola]|uniref:4-amino-4-deoxy-L-arabinose transferase-like glycosyltransferase n=1 Tax=Larkinella arboricola TaxID=643671 RepID=A0A327X7G8_LARAB|nr:hypothetical protein [Larkinella arboricola]RAK02599.1 hypothetical protein LX87_00719 [Larkinella arboricola]
MNQLITPNKILFFLLIGCLMMVATPLVLLSFYNHPSVVDDYCFAYTVMRFGVWRSQKFYYDGWTGRYFHNFIVHTSPLIWRWFSAYTIFPIVLLGLLWTGFFTLIRQIGQRVITTAGQIAIASGACFLYISQLRSIAEFFYWYTGLAGYSLACVLLLFLLGVFIAHDRQRTGWKSPLLLLEAVLVLCIIGSSETWMVVTLSFLGFRALVSLLYRRTIPVAQIGLLIWAGLCSYALIQAPGNAIRMGGNSLSQDFLFSAIETVKFGSVYFRDQLLNSSILILSALFLPVAYRLTDSHSPTRPYFSIYWWLALGFYLGLLFVLTFLHFWAVGVPPVARLLNVVNLVWVVGWFYMLTVFVRLFRHRISNWALVTGYRWPTVAVVAVLLGVAGYRNTNLRLTYDDLRSGRAREYHQQMEERYQLMTSSRGDTVAVPPLTALPASLVLEDLSYRSEAMFNDCWAGYFYRKGVKLRTASATATASEVQPASRQVTSQP